MNTTSTIIRAPSPRSRRRGLSLDTLLVLSDRLGPGEPGEPDLVHRGDELVMVASGWCS